MISDPSIVITVVAGVAAAAWIQSQRDANQQTQPVPIPVRVKDR